MIEPKKNSMPVIDLLPSELRRALPPLNSQEGISDPIVYAKFVSRESNWVWNVTEGSQQGDESTAEFVNGIGNFFLREELA